MKKRLTIWLSVLALFALTACAASPAPEAAATPAPTAAPKPEASGSIVVLFTSDVYGAAEENIGYAGLAAYRKALEEKAEYVLLADGGNAVQGSYLSAVSRGEYPVECMNAAGYDFCVPGPHEFGFGMPQLANLVALSQADYLCCNLSYTGRGKSGVAAVKPYEIVSCGHTDVAFIGVSTPESLRAAPPSCFRENGETVYDFHGRDGGEELYDLIQSYADECRAQGADYVLVLGYLGADETSAPFRSRDVAEHTSGIDAFLDGRAQTETPCVWVSNAEGEDVPICQAGGGLTRIGQLTIAPDGFITAGCVDYEKKDPDTEASLEELTADFRAGLQEVVAFSPEALSVADENGVRMVQSRETAIGNLCADACRIMAGADIGYVDGGGIHNGLPAGEITCQDLLDVLPLGRRIGTVELSGAEIADMLEYFYRNVQPDYVKNGKEWGESEDFGCISGLRCTVRADIPSSVGIDEENRMTGVGNSRRVRDILVLDRESGEYKPLERNRTYVFASHDGMLKNGGCGMGLFLENRPLILDGIAADYQNLMAYVQTLDGDLTGYAGEEGRVTVTG